MSKPVNISDSEWEVMNIVWNKAPVAASDIVEELSAKHEWRPRTIRTLLDRLVKKGALSTEEDGKRYLYRARVDRDLCVRKESQSFLQKVFGGEPAAMLINMVKHSELTAEEIKELKKILSDKEK